MNRNRQTLLQGASGQWPGAACSGLSARASSESPSLSAMVVEPSSSTNTPRRVSSLRRAGDDLVQHRLKRLVGIVESTRGPGGGYTLGRDTDQITVADVVQAVEDPADAAQIAADGLSQSLWQRLNGKLLEHMATVTLKSLVDEAAAAGADRSVRVPPATQRPSGLAQRPASTARPMRLLPPNSVFAFGRSFAR